MKNRYSAVIVILATFAAGIIATGLSFQPASASTRPVVVYAAGLGWHFGSARPYAIVIQGVAAGSGGAVVIGDGVMPMCWTSWTSRQATGYGYTETSGSSHQEAWITLSYVKTHGRSTRYFAHMAEKFSYADGAPHGLSQYFTWTGKSWEYAGYKIYR
jgi:hypothetical protein